MIPSLLHKSQPTQASVYVVPEVGQMVQAFLQESKGFVAGRVFPHVGVQQQGGKYKTFPRGYFFRDEMRKRADATPSAGGGFKIEEASYLAEVYAWHTKQGMQTMANAKMVDIDRAAAEMMAHKAMISLERDFFSNFFATTKWSTDIAFDPTPTGAERMSWMDATAKPIADLKYAKRQVHKRTGKHINKWVFSSDVFDVLSEHPNVVNRVNAGQTPGGPAEVNEQVIARLCGVDEIIVADGIYTTNAENETPANDAFDYIAPTGALGLFVVPNPTPMTATAGVRIDWEGYLNGAAGQFGEVVSRWWDQDCKAWKYEVEQARVLHQVSPDLGVFLGNLLSV